jgi:hypothetical protein
LHEWKKQQRQQKADVSNKNNRKTRNRVREIERERERDESRLKVNEFYLSSPPRERELLSNIVSEQEQQQKER